MEIVNKKKHSEFEKIEEGQCFVVDADPIDGIYMRMKFINKEFTYTGVNLKTGQLYFFIPDMMVTPINAKIEIE